MKHLQLLLVCLGCATAVSAQNPEIQHIINAVSIDSLIRYADELSGETGVTINGTTDTLYSRHRDQPGNELAYQYLLQKFTEYGLQVDSQIWSVTGKNALAYLPGTENPEQHYMICAHYDALGGAIAPAADDDGSGTAAMIEAARVLSQYEFENTIVFAVWDEEEQGKLGSAAFAQQSTSDTLLGVFNMDAIAYDGDGDGLARVHARNVGESETLADTVFHINTTYGIGLNMVENNPGATYSDHASFWNAGISAVLIIEDFDNDGNPQYHTPNDRVQFFDTTYFHQLSQLSIAAVAAMARPLPLLSSTDDVQRSKGLFAYPNPTNGAVQVSIPDASGAMLRVYNSAGRLVLERHIAGSATSVAATIDLSDQPTGLYLLQSVIESASGEATTHNHRLILR